MKMKIPVGVVVGVGIVVGHEIFNKIIFSTQYKKYKNRTKQRIEKR
jgi:hypothetical protein